MSLLLDTNTLLWSVHDPRSLSPRARNLISSPDQELYVSAVTAVELSIKVRLGKLPAVGMAIVDYLPWALPQLGALPLAFSLEHGAEVERLPRHHRDPFDWMLIAQARVEGLTLVTNDRKIRLYDVQTVW